MTPARLAELAEQAKAPEGIAVRIDATELAALLKERATLLGLLSEAKESMAECINNSDGVDRHEDQCGNCVGAIPVAHSLGCRIANALKAGGVA